MKNSLKGMILQNRPVKCAARRISLCDQLIFWYLLSFIVLSEHNIKHSCWLLTEFLLFKYIPAHGTSTYIQILYILYVHPPPSDYKNSVSISCTKKTRRDSIKKMFKTIQVQNLFHVIECKIISNIILLKAFLFPYLLIISYKLIIVKMFVVSVFKLL